MPIRDIFDKPFDDGTIVKLEIFQKYFEEWLPVFVMSRNPKPIQVFDLFAGSGYDQNHVPGSPIRTLEVIAKHRRILAQKKKQVFVFLNDADSQKIEQLRINIEQKVKDLSIQSMVVTQFSARDFRDSVLNDHTKELKSGNNLIFIDQNGFKEVNEQLFQFLMSLDTTDFIFFVSSSYVHRFPDEPEVRRHHPRFDFDKIKNTSWKKVHNVVCDEFRRYVPSNVKRYWIIPFSIMKPDMVNIYGLIAVTKHPLGADKFLNAAWKENALNGNANFDIEEEEKKKQGDFFKPRTLTKIESFQLMLQELILKRNIKNNSDAYYLTLDEGHIGKHANEKIMEMKRDKLITFDSPSSLVNYKKVEKEKRIIEYKLVKK
ncbi:MAG: three-Cys-motif partner protein TcmP [Bacteroidetes bacterium]|nr:three-Cys-motif partner protein TcmP [Bacteroidota bacterium]MCL5737857.1 three-Cys-motif partner protein TcmP [Bacteroidota bacterium]